MCNHGQTIYIIEAKFGNDGYAFYFKLCEILGLTKNHFIKFGKATSKEFLLAKTKISEKKAIEILDLLADLEEIDPELWREKIIWCDNFVNSLAPLYSKRESGLPKKPIYGTENNGKGILRDGKSDDNDFPGRKIMQLI